MAPVILGARQAGPMALRRTSAGRQQPVYYSANRQLKTARFTDTLASIDPMAWSNWGLASTATGTLVLPADATYDGGISSVAAYDLTSSSVFVNLEQVPNLGNGSTEAVFQVANTGLQTTYPVSPTAHLFSWNNGSLRMGTTINGVTTWAATAVYDPYNHGWLRIRENAGTVSYDTSPDASTWITQASTPAVFSVSSSYIQLYSGFTGTEETPGAAVFDDLNILPSWPTYTPTLPVSRKTGPMALRNRQFQKPLPWGTVLANPKTATLTDTFDLTDTSLWTYGADAAVANGQLALTTNDNGWVRTRLPYDVAGSSVSVRWIAPTGGDSSTFAYPLTMTSFRQAMWQDSFYNTIYWSQSTGKFMSVYFTPSAGTVVGTQYTYDSIVHAYLRLREAGGRIIYEFSSDASSWTAFGNFPAVFTSGDCTIQLYAGKSSGTASTTYFDDLNLLPSQPYFQPTLPVSRTAGPMALRRRTSLRPTPVPQYSTTRPKMDTYTDTFDTLNTGVFASLPGGAALVNGRLEMSSPAVGLQAGTTFDLTGSSLSARVVVPVEDLTYGLQVTMYVIPGVYAEGAQYFIGMGCQPNNVSGLYCWWNGPGLNYPGAGFTTYDPVLHKYWRIREAGGILYCETSPDASTWNLLHSRAPLPGLSLSRVRIVFATQGGVAPSKAYFDDLNLPPSNATYNPTRPAGRKTGAMALRHASAQRRQQEYRSRVDPTVPTGDFFRLFLHHRNQQRGP